LERNGSCVLSKNAIPSKAPTESRGLNDHFSTGRIVDAC
jgi:hypothetical protein